MSNERISIQDLVEQISQQSGRTKKSVEEFIRTLFLVIEEALVAEGIVKIKGLGTFKLIWNESRKSINVQTGKEFEIPGHNKVTFTPESSLRELVNEPFAHLSPVDLDSSEVKPIVHPLDKLNEQAEEIKGIISEINTISSKNKKADTSTKVETVIEENKEKIVKPSIAEKPITVEEINQPVVKQKKKNAWWLVALLFVLLFLGGAVYYFSDNDKCPFLSYIKNETVLSLTNTKPIIIPKTTEDTIAARQDTIMKKSEESIFEQPRTYNTIVSKEITQEGTRLTKLSKRYYGHKDFWVYIYEANKSHIANPDVILVGVEILIPSVDARLIDLNNPECLAYAKKLYDLYIKK